MVAVLAGVNVAALGGVSDGALFRNAEATPEAVAVAGAANASAAAGSQLKACAVNSRAKASS